MRRRPRPIWRRRAAWAVPCDGGAARRFSAKTQRVRAIRRGQSPPSTRPFMACGKRRERKEMGRCPTTLFREDAKGAGDPAGTVPAVHPPLLGLREATREERGGALPHAPAGGSSPCTRGTSCGRAKRRPRRRPGDSGGSRDSGQRAPARPKSAPICEICGFPFCVLPAGAGPKSAPICGICGFPASPVGAKPSFQTSKLPNRLREGPILHKSTSFSETLKGLARNP